MKGKLFLLPTVISEGTIDKALSPEVRAMAKQIDHYLVENIRTARRFLSALKIDKPIEEICFEILDKSSNVNDIFNKLQPILEGKNMAVLSEAGCPGIADPGSLAVEMAHELQIDVVPVVGPSSIFLALMASGFNGQCFKFNGYIPIDKKERVQAIRRLEKESQQQDITQIFMETPYRNNKLFETLLKNCRSDTKICIAKDITGKTEFIKTMNVAKWKSNVPDLHKTPAIFLLYVQS
ncbi:SAM-dependent methyltransferase [Fulvivirgaceae bacterium BMA10]|uniref:SAM-dependent methyltransferase n=1 Tax=Splendidivirga corallicola TaxID=3051826 RepID=A0ABT8KLF9_9BACT|nr:SAM-dependent methyltransferase [Fulvivirgaceae bacterium BMA10]